MNFYRILTILNNSKGIYFSLQEDKKDNITAAGGGTNEYVSTMSTHPQWEKSGFPELQNTYAQKCGRIPYAASNIYPTIFLFMLFGAPRSPLSNNIVTLASAAERGFS